MMAVFVKYNLMLHQWFCVHSVLNNIELAFQHNRYVTIRYVSVTPRFLFNTLNLPAIPFSKRHL